MSNTRHTPGPWRVEDSDPPQITTNPALAGGARTIAEMRIVAYSDLRERAANARLIAAAPDLLAACKSAERHFVGMDIDTGTVMDLLHAAIAKAEGGAT